eukprot:g17532.t1
MLQERMRGLEVMLQPSERVQQHIHTLQTESSRSAVLLSKASTAASSAGAGVLVGNNASSNVGGNKTGGGGGVGGNNSGTGSLATSSSEEGPMNVKDYVPREALVAKGGEKMKPGISTPEFTPSEIENSDLDKVEIDTKLLERVAAEVVHDCMLGPAMTTIASGFIAYPLVHFAGSKAAEVSLAPPGFVSEAYGMNKPLHLIPYCTAEQPLPTEKTLQLLASAACCHATVLLLIDGADIFADDDPMRGKGPNTRSDETYFGLYLLLAGPERKAMRELQEDAEKSPAGKNRNVSAEVGKDLARMGELRPELWQPLLTTGFGYGPHIVGSGHEASGGTSPQVASSRLKTVGDQDHLIPYSTSTKNQFYEQSCSIVLRKPELLAEIILQATKKGLYLAGLRTVYPSDAEVDKCCSILKHHLAKNKRNVVVAFRGPKCVELMAEIPLTTSLNARFGGLDNTHVVSPPARGLVDLTWAFGGRLERVKEGCEGAAALQTNGNKALLVENQENFVKKKLQQKRVTHAFHVFTEQTFSVGIRHCLSVTALLDKVGLYLRHAGKIFSVNPQKKKIGGEGGRGEGESSFVVTCAREGGVAFLARVEGLSDHVFPEVAMDDFGVKIRNLDQSHSYDAPVRSEDPVEICVTMLPIVGGEDLTPFYDLIQSSADNVALQTGASPDAVQSVSYGTGIDLISLRVVDFKHIQIQTSTEYFLRSPLLSESAKSGLVLFAVYRGEKCFQAVENYVLRTCKAQYAGSQGRWKFTKTSAESFHYFSVFFGLRSFFGPSSVLPSFGLEDLRCHERYIYTRSGYEAKKLGVSAAGGGGASSSRGSGGFFGGGSTSLTGRVSASSPTSRAKSAASTSVVSVDPGVLFFSSSDNEEVEAVFSAHSPKTKRLLSKETASGNKELPQKALVRLDAVSAAGASDDERSSLSIKFGAQITFLLVAEPFLTRSMRILNGNGFSIKNVTYFEKGKKDYDEFFDASRAWPTRMLLLQLYRSQNACKKLAKLLGHGDPRENAKLNYVSLRKGKSRVQSGCFCTSSAEFVKKMTVLLLEEWGDFESGNFGGSESDSNLPRALVRTKKEVPFRVYFGGKNTVEEVIQLLDHFLRTKFVVFVGGSEEVKLEKFVKTSLGGLGTAVVGEWGVLKPEERNGELDPLFFK